MGYGKRALSLLKLYYEGSFPCLDEVSKLPEETIESVDDSELGLLEERVGKLSLPTSALFAVIIVFIELVYFSGLCAEPRKNLPPLMLKLSERPPEYLDYMGVSYGVTAPLFKFWKKSGFVPVYLR